MPTDSTIRSRRLLGAHCSIAGGVENAPLIGARLGCKAIQMFTASNQRWRAEHISHGDAERFRANMERGKIEIAFAHAMYLINLAAPDPSIFKRSVEAMAGELLRADLLGLPFVVIHPGYPKDRGTEWGVRRAAEAISRIYDRVPDVGARIALETTAGQGSSIGRTFEEIAEIIDRSGARERLRVCFDTSHAFAAGYEMRTKEGYGDTWRSFDDVLGLKNLAAIHLNDSKGERGSRIDRHEHIGKGRIGVGGFRLLMNDPRFLSIPMVIETPKGRNGILQDSKNLRILRGLIASRRQ